MKLPPEVFAELLSEAMRRRDELNAQPGTVAAVVADRAAQWGADQELEACCEIARDDWRGLSVEFAAHLRAARRPKPPTLAEQGCNALDAYIYGNPDHGDKQNTYNTIRAALNRLAELEAQQ